MPKQITLQAFLDALNKQELRKNVKLNVEAELNASNQYDLKIRSIEVSKEVINELAIVPKKVREGIVKQPSLKDLVLKGFADINNQIKQVNDQMDKRFDQVDKQFAQVNKRLDTLEKLPTIAKELEAAKAKDRTR